MLNIIYSAKSSGGVFSSLIQNVDNFVIMVKKIVIMVLKKSIIVLNLGFENGHVK